MNPLKKSSVKQKRKTLETTKPIPKESIVASPVSEPKKALAQQYDSSGVDKQGYKTEPSPNSSPSIKFKPQNASPFGFPYAYLQHWYFEDENTTLFLVYSQGVVKISGSNLDDLFDHLNQYKIKEIYVTDKTNERNNETAIDSITIKRNREVEL